jgi:hypothetical protein
LGTAGHAFAWAVTHLRLRENKRDYAPEIKERIYENQQRGKSGILVEALPYIRKLLQPDTGRKVRGNAMISEEHQKLVITDLVLLIR